MRNRSHSPAPKIHLSVGDPTPQAPGDAAASAATAGQEALLALARELARQTVNELWSAQTKLEVQGSQ